MTRQDLIAGLPDGLRCAELGVFAGSFAREILSLMSPSHLYLVDTFTGDIDGMFTSADQDGLNRITMHMPTVRYMLGREFSGDECVEVCEEDSVLWLRRMPDASLDFIYIDTCHDYERTRQELKESMRVVRPGGWIAGHDYHERFPGVIQAVNEIGRPLTLTTDGLPSFMFVNL